MRGSKISVIKFGIKIKPRKSEQKVITFCSSRLRMISDHLILDHMISDHMISDLNFMILYPDYDIIS